MKSVPWSDAENDAIVADYFAMLADDQLGKMYNKAAHNRALQARIGRKRTSIEFKHQNISAVLKALGEDWIPGYKPAFNYQASLEDAVVRWLHQNQPWIERSSVACQSALAEDAAIWIEPAPTLKNTPPPNELSQMLRVAEKFDVAGRDERNRTLGEAGEERVLSHERHTLRAAGRTDLAERIVWTSKVEGDGAGFDISSFEESGEPRLIEVKTTNGWERTPFHISMNELSVADDRRSEWVLLRLWNFSRKPRGFEIRPPLDRHVSLTPTSFRASFDGEAR